MSKMLKRPGLGKATFIAEDQSAVPVGLVHVEKSTDWMTGEPCGYVSVLAVVHEVEGKGVAAGLMAAAEDRSRRRGFRLISLDVFASNPRARAFYAKQGYHHETLRLTKPLSPR